MNVKSIIVYYHLIGFFIYFIVIVATVVVIVSLRIGERMKGKYLFMRGLRSYSVENHHLIPPPFVCGEKITSSNNLSILFFILHPYYFWDFSNHCVYVPIYLRHSSGKSTNFFFAKLFTINSFMEGWIQIIQVLINSFFAIIAYEFID